MIEALWIGINLATLVVVLLAIGDAREAQEAIRQLNGKARELAAANRLGRETARLLSQIILLLMAVPALINPGHTELSFFVTALMALAVLNLVSSIGDTLSTRALLAMAAVDVDTSRKDSLERIEAQNEALAVSLAENTEISQQASNHADQAYNVANDINAKLAGQAEALIQQGIDRAEAAAAADDSVDSPTAT